jgi:SsrA-binding protein
MAPPTKASVTKGAKGTGERGIKIIASNRSARRDYEILETYEAGIVLKGSEVKSLREAKTRLDDAYARVINGELWLIALYIAPYSKATHEAFGHDTTSQRKLLVHRNEIPRLRARLDLERLTLVPLALYFKDGRVKVELALARGLTKGDQRQAIAAREADRDMRRAVGRAAKGRED